MGKQTNNQTDMDLRLIMVAVLFAQSVLPAPMCSRAFGACAAASIDCGPDEACAPSCATLVTPRACCIVRCEPTPADNAEAPCRPVCVPCPLGQPLAPPQASTQPTPPESALLPAPAPRSAWARRAAGAPIRPQQVSSLISPGSRSLLCVWII